MSTASTIGIQHYVPQFLLRNFCEGKKARFFAFDKAEGRSFPTNVRNVAGEQGFYDLDIGGVRVSVDPVLGVVERLAAPVISKIIQAESLADLTEDQRLLLAQFTATQLVRCRHTRERFSELSKAIVAELRSRGFNLPDGSGFSLSSRDAKFLTIQTVLGSDEFVPHILSKDWMLLRNQADSRFLISDNPVSRQNLRDASAIGVASRHVEIYLPISSRLCLLFNCPKLGEYCRAGIRRYEGLRSGDTRPPHFDLSPLRNMLRAIESGAPMDCDSTNVTNLNSLQVKFSERFVFSAADEFSLVREMTKSGRFRHGPRVSVS